MGKRQKAAKTLVLPVIGLALIAGSAVALYASTPSPLVAAYDRAPACATVAEAEAGKACRYTTTATVTGMIGTPDATYVTFELPAYGPFLTAEMPAEADAGTNWGVVVGGTAQVELWKSRVTRVNGAPTSDNPDNDPGPGTLRSVAFLLAALGLGFIGAALLTARARRNGGERGSGSRVGLGPIAVGDGLWGR